MRFSKLACMAVLITSLTVACGGSPAATTPAPIPTQAPGPTAALTAAPTAPVGATATPAGAAVDICSLLSPEELNQVTHASYLPSLLDAQGLCYWDGDQVGGQAGVTVIGSIQAADLSAIKLAFGTGGVDTTVSGHAAFYNPTQGLGSLWVDIGAGQLFVLSFPQSNDLDPTYKAIAEQLAGIALGHM
jgi:hypothetical protein